MAVGEIRLRTGVPQIDTDIAPAIPQRKSSRTEHGKVVWSDCYAERVSRARTSPHV